MTALTETKPASRSMTIIGAAIFLLSALAQQFLGVTITDADQQEILALATAAGEIVGGGLAIYGRIRATKQIGGTKSAVLDNGDRTSDIRSPWYLGLGVLMVSAALLSACAGIEPTAQTACTKARVDYGIAVVRGYPLAVQQREWQNMIDLCPPAEVQATIDALEGNPKAPPAP